MGKWQAGSAITKKAKSHIGSHSLRVIDESMQFSTESDVTLVVTSCGRFEHLCKTLESFDRYNTAPLKAVVVVEDSGSDAVHKVIPAHWEPHTTVLLNQPRLGQLAAIDRAYSLVDTAYVFHCEDDWEFYRPGFVEQSRKILESFPQVLQVWLRSFAHDVRVNYPFHTLGDRLDLDGAACYYLLSSEPAWRGFSFNPGLRRLHDYKTVSPVARFASSAEGESRLSQEFEAQGYATVILESDAVLHTGDDAHVWADSDRQKQRKKRKRKIGRIAIGASVLVLGMVAGYIARGLI